MKKPRKNNIERVRRGSAAARTDSCSLEPLEDRMLLSGTIKPTFVEIGTIGPAAAAANSTIITPSQMRSAYGVNQITFNGIAGNGAGETIAIIDAYNAPTILSDANAFSSNYGLPDFNVSNGPTLKVLNETGGTSLPGADPSGRGGWDLEESLDVEWAHTIAPEANIDLFEATSSSFYDFVTDEATAAATSGVVAVSNSWGGSDFPGEQSLDSYFTTPAGHPGVTFLASTGDTGGQVDYPSASPNVVAVGGTTLTVNTNGTWASETAWSGGGGGVSIAESQPSYQAGKVNGISSTHRSTPDVSMDANPNTGVPVLDSYYTSSYVQVGGTSLACPMWAGLIAIIDQGRAINGLGSLDGASQTLPMLYSLPSSDFRDITSGSNGFSAQRGYDLTSGIGSPIANLLVPAMAGFTASSATQVAFVQQPTSDIASANIAPSVSVAVEGSTGNVQTSDASTVTVSINSGPSGAVLGGNTTVTAVNGIATFSNLTLSIGGVYTLKATDGSLTTAVSLGFTVVVPTPPVLASAESVKVEGGANYGINLPLNLTAGATPGIEDRYGGPTLVALTFGAPVTLGPGFVVSLTSAGGGADGNLVGASLNSSNPDELDLSISGAINQQTMLISVSNVEDIASTGTGTYTVDVGVLLGDIGGYGAVNGSDFALLAAAFGQPTNAQNFAADLLGSGVINGSDFSLFAGQFGESLQSLAPAVVVAARPASSNSTSLVTNAARDSVATDGYFSEWNSNTLTNDLMDHVIAGHVRVRHRFG